MKRDTLLLILGTMLMAWGGSSVNNQLGLSGLRSADLVIFALGLLIIAQSHVLRLETRVAKLEAELSGGGGANSR